MRPEQRDFAYLWDMLQAARSLRDFTRGLSFDEFAQDLKTRLAAERQLEIIGEAGRRVSRAFREKHPEIPWQDIIGLRNIISHEYDKIDSEQIHAIVLDRVPELIEHLTPLVPPAPETNG